MRGELAERRVPLIAAGARGDAGTVAAAARALKWMASSVGGALAFEAAWRLERLGTAGDLAGADAACRALERVMANLTPP